MGITAVSGDLYLRLVGSGAAELYDRKEYVNELNVFPVPDGDTGDNMFMTIDSGFRSTEEAESLSETSEKVAEGMLLGARGNSGVILSRIFAGIAKSLSERGVREADIFTFSEALKEGSRESYRAVSHPVEGTILSVFKDGVNYADSRLREDTTLEEYLDDLLTEFRSSLSRTPELLQTLKEAGVVDSGGAGILAITEGMRKALYGEFRTPEKQETSPAKEPDLSLFTADSILEFGYCTEFLLRLQKSKVDLDRFDVNVITDWLNAHGDSVVSFRDGTIVKVHVHTHNPGEILNEMQKYGEFLKLKIENMMVQHEEKIRREEPEKVVFHKKYGTVVVSMGEGVTSLLREMGVDEIIPGGQTMNPSTEDFVRAFERTNADTIFVFPNNPNVFMAAEQAKDVFKKDGIRIVPAKDIGACYAALSMMDTSRETADEVMEDLTDAMKDSATGFVSKATRDAAVDGVTVRCGEYIAFSGKTIYGGGGRTEALLLLGEKMSAGSYDIALLLWGGDVTAEESERAAEALRAAYPDTEVIPRYGGQPVYDYIMILQ